MQTKGDKMMRNAASADKSNETQHLSSERVQIVILQREIATSNIHTSSCQMETGDDTSPTKQKTISQTERGYLLPIQNSRTLKILKSKIDSPRST
jgi:hypothetical protein